VARLQKLLLPDLVWNQESYGMLLLHYLQEKPRARWLDAGCGCRILSDGLETLEDSAASEARFVVGMDADCRSLTRHRNIGLRVCSSLDAIPFPDLSFDLVTCNMVVEHLVDPRQCFAEMARVLAPGGIVVIHTPNLRNYMVFLNHTLGHVLPRSWVLRLIQAGEGRETDEVFHTFYRMNSVRRLRELAGDLRFCVEEEQILPSPQPFFNWFLPLAFIQLLLMRLMALPFLRGLEATLLVALRKTELSQTESEAELSTDQPAA